MKISWIKGKFTEKGIKKWKIRENDRRSIEKVKREEVKNEEIETFWKKLKFTLTNKNLQKTQIWAFTRKKWK